MRTFAIFLALEICCQIKLISFLASRNPLCFVRRLQGERGSQRGSQGDFEITPFR